MNKSLYETYHGKSGKHRRVIDRYDYTYRNLIGVLSKYLSRNSKVLDIGSGVGTLDMFVSSRVNSVDSIEISKKATDLIKSNKALLNIKNIKVINSSFERFSTHKKYQLIFMFEVLEHLRSDTAALRKVFDLADKSSYFIMSVPSIKAPLYKLGLLKKFDIEVGHLRRYEKTEIINKLKEIGFKVVKVYEFEGLVRNSLFTNKYLGLILKLTKFRVINEALTLVDALTGYMFGFSQIVCVCKKR